MDDKENTLEHARVMPVDLTYKKLEEITNGFSEEHKVGSGGYGVVYKVWFILVFLFFCK